MKTRKQQSQPHDQRVQIQLRVLPELKAKLEQEAKKQNRTLSNLIETILEIHITQQEEGKE